MFQVPEDDQRMMAIQYHVAWEKELLEALQVRKREAAIVPG